MASSQNFPDTDAGINPGLFRDRTQEDLSQAPATSAEAQILLQALQNYIMPLLNKSTRRNNTSQTQPSGPEAAKLLDALQEYISSIVIRSQQGYQNGIEVDLQDDENAAARTTYETGYQSSATPSPEAEDEPSTGSSSKDNNDRPGQNRPTKYLEKALSMLREHVYNRMPIRLLRITPRRGSKLNITLVERGDVYALAAEKLQNNYLEQKLQGLKVTPTTEGKEKAEIDALISKYTGYAILSHTWLRAAGGEVTYNDWHKGAFDAHRPGYQKLVNFCKVAWKNHRLMLAWMDTVCINKESSSELDESIRSMYKWYENSTVCITYLAATHRLSDIHKDPWFTRGWTFQEMLAPEIIKFYNVDWEVFVNSTSSDRGYRAPDILEQVHQATSITSPEWDAHLYLPISRKMQLAANREVSREEDIAYSLMGICNVSISIAYGEGAERAFSRLMTEMLNSVSSGILDAFNCAQWSSSIIPSTPLAYLTRWKDVPRLHHQRPMEPLILTHLGLRMSILLMPALSKAASDFNNEPNPIGDYYAAARVSLRIPGKAKTAYFHLLDKGLGLFPLINTLNSTESKPDSNNNIPGAYTTFGVMNVGGDKIDVKVPHTCLAIGFISHRSHRDLEWESTSTQITRHHTNEPIIFDLKKKNARRNEHLQGYSIQRRELSEHGMELVTMYL